MTDEITTTVDTPSTETNIPTVQPVNGPKPYDDELLEEYAKEENGSGADSSSEADPKQQEETKEIPKEDEKPKEEEVKPGERKGDKVEDNFGEVKVVREINGKQVEFSVDNAIQAFVKQEEFNRNMDSRVTKISQREKRWNDDQVNFKSKIGKLMEVAQAGDFVKAIRGIAKFATSGTNLNPVDFEKAYFEQLDKIKDVYGKMTPQERETFFTKRRADEAEKKLKAIEEDNEVKASKSQLQESVLNLQKQNGISNDEFWGNYDDMAKALVGEDKRFKTADDITAQDVVAHSLDVKHWEKVITAADKVGVKDDEALNKLFKVTSMDRSVTVDEIVKVLKSAGYENAPAQAVENLNRKAEKSKLRFSQGNSTKKQNGIPEGYDEEILSHLYRNQPKVYRRPVR